MNFSKLKDVINKEEKHLSCDYVLIRIGSKYNYINEQGNLFFEDWFDNVDSFSGGFAKVQLNGKYNLINQNGDLLSPNLWFNWCGKFNNGSARVELNGKWNFINQKGDILSPNQWFNWCEKFNNGFARVELNDKYNWIDVDGNYLSTSQWFDCCGFFNEDGLAYVRFDNHTHGNPTDIVYNVINKKGELLCSEWFKLNFSEFISEGFVCNGKTYFIKYGVITDSLNKDII